MKKKKILICNDAHFLSTGYGKYGKELLTRLAHTNKYELAELACYGFIDSVEVGSTPWRYYANAVRFGHPDFKEYVSNSSNELGEWRFDKTVLHFQPDIVIDIRDIYASKFIYNSLLKPYYHLVAMPTIDSIPQKSHWIEDLRHADTIALYSEWSINYIKQFGFDPKVCSPGVDTEIFKPKNLMESRKKLGINHNKFILGTVMRNQGRKLYPELFNCFSQINTLNPDTYLYVHAGYPDSCWNFPELLLQNRIQNNVYFTYICENCKECHSSLYKGVTKWCPKCGHRKCSMPFPENGVDEEQLSDIYNTMNLYIQYATAEGFGIPQIEAASCGIPVAAIDYSAMSDIIHNTSGIPLKPKTLFVDQSTHAYRAIPDVELTADIINKYIQQTYPYEYHNELKNLARQGVLSHYTWDKCVKSWEAIFDNIELSGKQGNYFSKPKPSYLNTNIPQNLNDSDFVDWVIVNVINDPTLLNSIVANTMKYNLHCGYIKSNKNKTIFNREILLEQASTNYQIRSMYDGMRTNKLFLEEEDFLLRAKL